MGATVTCGKSAAAFVAPDGRVRFVLFEETYEKNVHPWRPHRSCVAFGTVEDVLRRVFAYASACEGGMLQGRGGAILPESYVASWMKELAAPARMPDLDVRLRRTESYASPVPADQTDTVARILREENRGAEADAIEAGREIALSLHRDAAILSRIYGGGALSPWRIIGSCDALAAAPRDASLGYAPEPARSAPIEPVEVLAVADREERLLRSEDGEWHCAGWAYSVVARYVEAYWRTELDEPGTYRRRIRAFREAVNGAEKVPEGATIIIDPSKARDRWESDRVRSLIDKGVVVPVDGALVAVPTDETLYDLCGLGKDCATWAMPKAPSTARQLALL
jgi:hypothetical protein